MRIVGKLFLNEKLVIKILRCLNFSWQPKFIVIYEYKDLATMDTHTHTHFVKLQEHNFVKLQEHKMELKRLAIYEEGKQKNKNQTLKVEEFDYDGYMYLIVKNFKRLLKNEKKQKTIARKI